MSSTPRTIIAVAVRIDRADIHENTIPEFAGKLAPYPLQRIDATAAARAHDEHRSMAARIEPWRVKNFRICDPAQCLVRSANLSSNGCIMRVIEETKGDHDAGDHHGHSTAFGEFLDQRHAARD